MNTSAENYESSYQAAMETYFWPFRFLNGNVEIIPVTDTLQVNDYARYEMKGFREEHKKAECILQADKPLHRLHLRQPQ